MAAYNIGQMEWDAAAAVDEAYVDEFRDNNVYTRFANPSGGGPWLGLCTVLYYAYTECSSDVGLWSCFHPDGGCTLFFMDRANSLPIWGNQR